VNKPIKLILTGTVLVAAAVPLLRSYVLDVGGPGPTPIPTVSVPIQHAPAMEGDGDGSSHRSPPVPEPARTSVGGSGDAGSPGSARGRVQDPYEAYDSETLAVLAYSDAQAAKILALRLRRQNEKEALAYVLRSAALSGRPDAISAFRNASPYPVAIDGRPVARSLREQYVLSVVADALYPDPGQVALWESTIRSSLPRGDQEIDSLRRQAAAILRRMQDIQRQVIGAASIGGLDDV